MSQAISVGVQRRIPTSDELARDVQRVRRLAKLMDSQFKVFGRTIGWDPIVGLVPVVGDIATALVGLYPIIIARKHGLGKTVQTRMAVNLLIDFAVGELPVLGDIFDAGFKANLKNADLLERALRDRRF